MKKSSVATIIAALATVFALSNAAFAGSPTMRVIGQSSPPIGHVKFCEEYPTECGSFAKPQQVVRLTGAVWDRLRAINLSVNQDIVPLTDMEIFGVIERWTYPDGIGDCEDYVLEKRRRLIADGWPASALLITVVRDEVGEGHAVLTVRTDRGDLILDNKNDQVLVWDMTPYQFVKRQSVRHAAAWDAIADDRAMAVGSLGR